jgi:hypothetical protein
MTPAKPIGPEPVSIVVMDNAAAGWRDVVAEAWFVVPSGAVLLTHADGRPLDGGRHKAELSGQKALEVAQLLRRRAGVSNEFMREKIPYPKVVF